MKHIYTFMHNKEVRLDQNLTFDTVPPLYSNVYL